MSEGRKIIAGRIPQSRAPLDELSEEARKAIEIMRQGSEQTRQSLGAAAGKIGEEVGRLRGGLPQKYQSYIK